MSFPLKLQSRKREWRMPTRQAISVNQRARLNQDLHEVFNLTFTDYCSTRTKKKLDCLITKPFKRADPPFFGNCTERLPEGWLVVQPTRMELAKTRLVNRLKT
jgi:hypothetical protein